MIKRILLKIVNSTFFQHLVFWSLAWYILLKLFSTSSETTSIDYIYITIFLIPVAVSVYINIMVLIPKLLSLSRYLSYFLSLLMTVAFFSWVNLILFSSLIDYILPGFYFISYFDYDDLLKIFAAFTVITTLLELSKAWFRLAEASKRITLLEKERTEAELTWLRNQINPHFLFNSLNSLYSLVMTRSDSASSYVLKLSEFLRYSLYETASPLVPLEKELESIKSFIEIQKLRLGRTALLDFKITGDPAEKWIAPLLFLPVIENTFKHGIKPGGEKSHINISIEIFSDSILLKTENPVSAREPATEMSGIGLENLSKRLQRLYPQNYTFHIESEADTFVVKLIIPLKNETQLSDNRR